MSEDKELDQPRRSFFALLWGTIRRPRDTMDYLSQSGRRAWMAMALLAALSVVILVVVRAPISARMTQEAIRTQLESQPSFAPSGDQAEMEARISQFASNPLLTMVTPSITGILTMLIGWLVWAGALHLLSVIIGGDSHFGLMWAGVVWSYLPIVLRNGMQTIFVLSTGELIANQGLSGFVTREQDVAEMIASPPSSGQLALQSLLSQIDLFNIWNLILLFIAVMAVARLSRRKALGITLAVWAGLLLINILITIGSTQLARGFS